MNKEIMEKLYAPFELKERKGHGGRIYKYVPSEDVIDRMNKVFGGMWSTEIISYEIIEDNILVKVKVTVKNENNSELTFHEGFAAHNIARFTSGQNQGKPLSLSNDFKSATSKAIRSACKNFGVALYLDDEDSGNKIGNEMHSSASQMSMPVMPMGIYGNQEPTDVKLQFAMPNDDISKKAPQFNNNVAPSVAGIMPGFGPSFNTSSAPIPVNNTVSDEQLGGVIGNVPVNNDNTTFGNESDNDDKLTDIQKVAIEAILSNNSVTLKELFEMVFKDPDRAINIDSISYIDAVSLIREGNKIGK